MGRAGFKPTTTGLKVRISVNKRLIIHPLTALRSAHNRDAKCSRCRRCPIAGLTSADHKRVIVRVFDIDIETCSQCGGEVKIIAGIEDPVVIRKTLAHLDKKATSAGMCLS